MAAEPLVLATIIRTMLGIGYLLVDLEAARQEALAAI